MKRALPLVALLWLGACYRDTQYVSHVQADPAPAYDKWRHRMVFGLANLNSEIDLRAVCPQGVARIETQTGILSGLLGVVSVGIYTPTELAIYCQSAPGGPPWE